MTVRRAPVALSALAVAAMAALSACTSTQDVLDPNALVDAGTAAPPPGRAFPLDAATNPVPQGSTPAPGQVAAISTSARVRFAPVVGAPDTAAQPLAGRLAARASQRGIGLAAADDRSATHIMKGYFSAISEAGETTVIYVWDVMDPAGTRIHRIQGQAKAPAGRADGWESVQAATMEAIADQTVEQLASWLVARPG